MNKNSIAPKFKELQDAEWKFEYDRFKSNMGEVYCPMCQIYHANHTMCQANLGNFHE